MHLLSDGLTNAKTLKSFNAQLGYHTAILYLAPYKTSKVINMCKSATPGCIFSCLFTAGRGRTSPVQKARIRKTLLFKNDQELFLKQLEEDIHKFHKKCMKLNLNTCIRLNGTSDEYWENCFDMSLFPNVQFYDYTKHEQRMVDFLDGKLPKNYHLTFSQSERNQEFALDMKRNGANVAVVFDRVPDRYKRFLVFNGDNHDLRFLDQKTGLCGLTAKGKAKKDKTGFVVRI